jgi:hypothetical protein
MRRSGHKSRLVRRRGEAIGPKANQIANRYRQKPIIATGPVNCQACAIIALSSGTARAAHLALLDPKLRTRRGV